MTQLFVATVINILNTYARHYYKGFLLVELLILFFVLKQRGTSLSLSLFLCWVHFEALELLIDQLKSSPTLPVGLMSEWSPIIVGYLS